MKIKDNMILKKKHNYFPISDQHRLLSNNFIELFNIQEYKVLFVKRTFP